MQLELVQAKLKETGRYRWTSDAGQELQITRNRIAEIPFLLAGPADDSPRPTVFVQHGLSGCKEQYAGFCMALAEHNLNAVALDARCHGERRPDNFEQLIEKEVLLKNLLSFIRGTAQDIIDIYEALISAGVSQEECAAITGFSMGGFISFLLPVLDSRFKVSAPIAGSAVWLTDERQAEIPEQLRQDLVRLQPVAHLDVLSSVSWLIQHGEKDEVVPPEGSRRFYEEMKQQFPAKHDLTLITYPDAGHELTPEMVSRTVQWIARLLT